jgi:hypothetical protein
MCPQPKCANWWNGDFAARRFFPALGLTSMSLHNHMQLVRPQQGIEHSARGVAARGALFVPANGLGVVLANAPAPYK